MTPLVPSDRQQLYAALQYASQLRAKIASANRFGPSLSDKDLKFLQRLLSAYEDALEKRCCTLSTKLAKEDVR